MGSTKANENHIHCEGVHGQMPTTSPAKSPAQLPMERERKKVKSPPVVDPTAVKTADSG
jgi:hypothetical protein